MYHETDYPGTGTARRGSGHAVNDSILSSLRDNRAPTDLDYLMLRSLYEVPLSAIMFKAKTVEIGTGILASSLAQ